MKWDGVVVLVTGGTRGIGKELVGQLVDKGCSVIATGQSRQSVNAAQLQQPSASWFTLDLSSGPSRDAFAEAMGSRGIDIVINNAGVQQLRDFTNPGARPELDTEREIAINLTGPIELTRALLPGLRKRTGAKVVFVTSGLALAPKRSSPVYCATKAALRSFAKSLRAQARHAGWSLSVAEALPPLVDTAMTRGRGKRKMSPKAAASQIIAGIAADKEEIYVGASRVLRMLMRVSPRFGEALMIDR